MINFKSKSELLVILTTERDLAKAEVLAEIILSRKYAACISFNEIKSSYWWNGKLENSKEIQLVIKTKKDNLNKIKKIIKKKHSYSNPEIIFWTVDASREYAKWINEII